ncbi:hypothetical protein F5B18DRAFT_312913 [Nemania serpens]|nr:hypothetical protein F5B18DRAFT_312913 [Nemania serpens]
MTNWPPRSLDWRRGLIVLFSPSGTRRLWARPTRDLRGMIHKASGCSYVDHRWIGRKCTNDSTPFSYVAAAAKRSSSLGKPLAWPPMGLAESLALVRVSSDRPCLDGQPALERELKWIRACSQKSTYTSNGILRLTASPT